MMKRTSILTKLVFLFLVIFLLATGSFVHLLVKSNEKQLISQGRNIAQMVVLFRRWATDYGGVWSKDKYHNDVGFLSSHECVGATKTFTNEVISQKEAGTFFLHNPALATHELSKYADEKYGYVFNVVSQHYMAEQSKPDLFEVKAMSAIKSDASLNDEYWGWDRGYFRYTKALYIEEGCLKCHGEEASIAENTKRALKSKYGDKVAWGYKVGELRGVISVKIVPQDPIKQAVGFVDAVNLAAFGGALALFILFTKYVIVGPIERLTHAAHYISLGKLETELGIENTDEKKTRDEITLLSFAINRLKTSIKIAMQMIQK